VNCADRVIIQVFNNQNFNTTINIITQYKENKYNAANIDSSANDCCGCGSKTSKNGSVKNSTVDTVSVQKNDAMPQSNKT
jgi:hypothetical protein